MTSLFKKAALAILGVGFTFGVYADVAPDFMEKLESESRPLEDRMRDGARRPYQVMQLLGVDAGMTAMDIGAGGGWYTRVLSAAVGPEGHVIMQAGPRGMRNDNGQAARDMASSLGNVEVSFDELQDMDSNLVDVAVSGLNLHHMDAERAVPYLNAIYDVLKPGGVAALTDHVGMPGMSGGNVHRVLISDVRSWIEASNLEIVEESDLLRTNADDHQRSAFDAIYGRNTDRFLFVVRKPQ